MASELDAHALICQRCERLLGQVLQSLGAPEAVRLRVLTWERRNRLRIRCQFLIVEVLYRRILLHRYWKRWNNPWWDLDFTSEDSQRDLVHQHYLPRSL